MVRPSPPLQSCAIQYCAGQEGKLRLSSHSTKQSLSLPAPPISRSSGSRPKTHLFHPIQIRRHREKFLGTISPVFVDIQQRPRRRSTRLPAQLSLLRRGRGENRKPFSKDFNQSNCIFRFDDNSLGCVSMFELFWI